MRFVKIAGIAFVALSFAAAAARAADTSSLSDAQVVSFFDRPGLTSAFRGKDAAAKRQALSVLADNDAADAVSVLKESYGVSVSFDDAVLACRQAKALVGASAPARAFKLNLPEGAAMSFDGGKTAPVEHDRFYRVGFDVTGNPVGKDAFISFPIKSKKFPSWAQPYVQAYVPKLSRSRSGHYYHELSSQPDGYGGHTVIYNEIPGDSLLRFVNVGVETPTIKKRVAFRLGNDLGAAHSDERLHTRIKDVAPFGGTNGYQEYAEPGPGYVSNGLYDAVTPQAIVTLKNSWGLGWLVNYSRVLTGTPRKNGWSTGLVFNITKN